VSFFRELLPLHSLTCKGKVVPLHAMEAPGGEEV
jgi:hypothetical protein